VKSNRRQRQGRTTAHSNLVLDPLADWLLSQLTGRSWDGALVENIHHMSLLGFLRLLHIPSSNNDNGVTYEYEEDSKDKDAKTRAIGESGGGENGEDDMTMRMRDEDYGEGSK
jgi:hypothetical protein